jgi:hypothetical protein
MAKQALQNHPLLLLPPAQLAQKQVKLGKIRTPVLRILWCALGFLPGSRGGGGWRHWRQSSWRVGPWRPWLVRLKMMVQAASRPIFCLLCTGCLT